MSSRGKSDLRSFAFDNLVVAATLLLMKLRGIIALPLIIAYLGTEGFGLWTQVLSVVTFGSAIFGLNLHLPLIRMIAGDPSDAGRVYATTLASTLVFGALGVAFVFVLGRSLVGLLLGDSSQTTLLVWCGLLVVVYNLRNLNVSFYRAAGRFALRSVVDFSSAMVELVGILWFLGHGKSLVEVLMFMVGWNAIVSFATTLHVLSVTGLFGPTLDITKKVLRYALPLTPGALAWLVIDRSDRFVIGHYLGAKEVGIYSAAYALGSLILNYQAPFQMTLLPKVAQVWATDRDLAKRYIEICIRIFLGLAIPSVVGMPIVAPIVLGSLANEEIARQSALIATTVSAAVVMQGLAVMQTQIFHGAKRTDVLGIAMTAAALLNVALTFALVPRLGILGAAISSVVGYTVLTLALVRLARPHLVVSYHPRFCAVSLLGSFVMLGCLWLIHPTRLVGLLVALVPAVLLYFAVVLSLGLTSAERAALRAAYERRLARRKPAPPID